jgi:hypothetical protein
VTGKRLAAPDPRGTIGTMKTIAVGLVLAASLVIPASSLAAAKTTTPSKYVLVEVLIKNQRVIIGAWQGTQHHGDMIPLAGAVPRGDFISFSVLNRTKHVQQFTIFGKKTPNIKPGGKAHLFVAALIRGSFPYKTTSPTGKSFHGVMTVA